MLLYISFPCALCTCVTVVHMQLKIIFVRTHAHAHECAGSISSSCVGSGGWWELHSPACAASLWSSWPFSFWPRLQVRNIPGTLCLAVVVTIPNKLLVAGKCVQLWKFWGRVTWNDSWTHYISAVGQREDEPLSCALSHTHTCMW